MMTDGISSSPVQFELRLRNTYKTNGGHMFDLNVTFENKETKHRVIVGKEYSEAVDLEPEEVLAMTFAFLLRYKVPRQTEGVCKALASTTCPMDTCLPASIHLHDYHLLLSLCLPL